MLALTKVSSTIYTSFLSSLHLFSRLQNLGQRLGPTFSLAPLGKVERGSKLDLLKPDWCFVFKRSGLAINYHGCC